MPITINTKSKSSGKGLSQRLQDILAKAKIIDIAAWEAANTVFEERILKNFIKNADSKDSELDGRTIDWKIWSVKSGKGFKRSAGGESRTARPEFVSSYARHTGYLLEKIEQHYKVGTESKFFSKTLKSTSGVTNGKLEIKFNVDAFIRNYPKRLFPSIMSTKGSVALISLTPSDVQAIQKTLVQKIAESLKKRTRR